MTEIHEQLDDRRRLMRLRRVLNVSQREMAEELGVVHGAVGLWESGKRKIPGPVQKLIALYEHELGLADETDSADEERALLESLESTWLGRTLSLSNLGLKVIGKHIVSSVKDGVAASPKPNAIQARAQEALARQMVETFGVLKGLPHKLGQLVSYMDLEASDAARAEYAQLQQLTPAMAPSVIAEVIVEEFRQTPRQLFAEWSDEAFAAASIGQVHRATTHEGEAVAVKVQYPKIRDIVCADLKNVAVLERLGAVLAKTHEPGALLEEMAERFMQECDYEQEAQAQQEFAQLWADDERIFIPQVFPKLSSARVLTTEYIDAQRYSAWLLQATQDEKNRAAEAIWDYGVGTAVQHGIFNADPHPGNYLFRAEQVVFIDYGCVRRLAPETHAHWRRYLRSICENDIDAFADTLLVLGMIPQPEQFDFTDFFAKMRCWYEPWYCDQPYTFTREGVAAMWKRITTPAPNHDRLTFPRELLFVNQLQWGQYALLADLNATSHWSQRMRAALASK